MRTTKNIQLLYGEDRYLLETEVKKIKNTFNNLVKGINYIVKDEKSVNTIISDIETPSFNMDKKLILVKNSGLFKKDNKNEFIHELIQYFDDNNIANTYVIFIENEVSIVSKLFKKVKEKGDVIVFNELKPAELRRKVKSIFAMYGIKISEDNVMYFIETCGTNMQELINEIRKLVEYTGKGNEVERDIIKKLCTPKLDVIIFDLTDNLSKREVGKSINILNQLILDKEPIQKILIILYGHMKKLYLIKKCLEFKKDISEISLSKNKISDYAVNKYMAQSKMFTEKQLLDILGSLIDLDIRSKEGRIDLKIGLDSILCAKI